MCRTEAKMLALACSDYIETPLLTVPHFTMVSSVRLSRLMLTKRSALEELEVEIKSNPGGFM